MNYSNKLIMKKIYKYNFQINYRLNNKKKKIKNN